MTGIKLAVPYNHDPRYPGWLAANLAGVAEVYFPLHISVIASGRPWMGPSSEADYLASLRDLAGVMGPAGLTANVIVNLPVPFGSHQPVVQAVERVASLFPRTVVTVLDIEFARRLMRNMPGVKIGVSTLANIDSSQKAIYWRDEVGVDSVTISRDINKKLDAIRRVRSTGLKIKMVLDDQCVPQCPATMVHMGLLAERSEEAEGCLMHHVRRNRLWAIAQKDVVPATLPRYDGLIDVAKLEGRNKPLAFIEGKVRSYLACEDRTHPYGIYREPEEAFEKICSCDRQCHRCDWCERHIELLPGAADALNQ